MSDEADEQRWISQARGGDRVAFTSLVSLHQGRVRAYVAGHVRHKVVVDDLCQDVFVRAYRRIADFRGDGALGPWLLAIARNRTIDHLRAEVRRRGALEDELGAALVAWQLGGAQDDADLLGARRREIDALSACVEALPGPTAALVRAYYVEEKRVVEIARDRDRSPGAVRMTLLRVRQALRDCIQRRMAEAGE